MQFENYFLSNLPISEEEYMLFGVLQGENSEKRFKFKFDIARLLLPEIFN